jgi:hypothetical protein
VVAVSVPAPVTIQHASEQGLSQVALAIAPAGALGLSHAGTPTTDVQGARVATTVFGNAQAGPRQTTPTPTVSATHASTPDVSAEAAATTTTPETLNDNDDSESSSEPSLATPVTPVAQVAPVAPVPADVTARLVADALFADPRSLTILRLDGAPLTLTLADSATGTVPQAEDRGENTTLAGAALFAAGWWFAVSSPTELHTRSKRLKGWLGG